MKTTIKVYRLNDCDWFAGPSLESCVQCYLRDYIHTPDSLQNRDEYIDDEEELSDEQMERLKFTDTEGEWGEKNKEYTFQSALEQMIQRGVVFPAFFASTEF